MKIEYTNAEHKEHCRIAECTHPAIYSWLAGESYQGWCARCRSVAFGGVYEGLVYIDGKVITLTDVGKA